ncbi:hypothetical protein EP7_000560 [Isosphaeraceae bacterium EP7]
MTADDDLNAISDESIDALVDGTLDDDRRRALLLALEADLEGWRRCALAFLEAQAWTQALAPLADHPAATIPFHSPLRVPAARRPLRSILKYGLAASLLASAFGAGLLANRPTPPDRPSIASSVPITSPQPLVETPAPESAELASNPHAEEFDHGMNAIPGHVRRQLASQGYKVEQRRMLVDVPLEDGRLLEVPVDQVSFEYVGIQAL